MNIPKLNPLKFYKTDSDSYSLDSMSFTDYSEHWTNRKEYYKPSYLDKCENIYYKDVLDGEYGFTNSNNFTTIDADSYIYYGVYKLVNANTYELTGQNGKYFVAKLETDSNVLVTVRQNGSIVYQASKTWTKSDTIKVFMTSNNNINIEITGSADLYGVAIADIEDNYTFNDNSRTSQLIGLSQYGVVYKISSMDEVDFLPSAGLGDDYNDVVRKYIIDISPNYQPKR